MKLNLTLIFLVCTFLHNANTSLWAETTLQQPPTERQFNDGFKESYSGRKYNYKGAPKARSTSAHQQHNAEYSEDQPYIPEESADGFSFNLNGLNWVFVVILFLAVGYLAYTLLNDGSSKLFSSRKNTQINSFTDISAENIAHVDIKTLIKNAENTNDYRLAIRYYYLLVLKHLTLKNFITFEEDKTNADYMQAIASQKFSKDFAYTSYIYNYTWYGEFALNAEQYQLAKESFVQLIKKVNS
ncbi:hypothetical protein BXY82_1617 [Gelidibacter sediminis]|uniref:DUF4129 domain-containing protein n=1 Tax=Gelidibacter sediminis TaxID=1608710 RepID=A0A4R7PZN0_9FLAO|nr:hypothetical protein [Gelidibacter sediminis]TDU39590.1 hypothetical protein BXY82_1617 [Gelidibacter sediminis]